MENQINRFAIVEEPIDLNQVVCLVTSPDIGGVCFFTGMVRGITQLEDSKLETDHLVYEAYAPMAEQKLEQIAVEIRQRFPKVKQIALVQRVGRLEIGDIAVVVACASGHRNDGVFRAAEYGINRLKEIVPVWKKETGSAGEVWVEGSYHPTPEDNHPG
jgi:molybdopterin synthase catalytic subunit